MRRPAGAALAVLAIGLVASQLGHALAYALSFGTDAVQRQSAGSHAYFPGLLGLSVTLAAGGLMVVLLLIGLARQLAVRRLRVEPAHDRPALRLMAALLLVQLGVFVAQELLEAAAAGATPGPLPLLVASGLAGNLPVAVAAAVVLSWLSAPLGRALRAFADDRLQVFVPDGLAALPELRPRPRQLRGGGALGAPSQRGPPHTSR